MTIILGVMTWTQWVWCHTVVGYHIEWMCCSMYFIWCHTYCGCFIIHTIGVIWLIILVWWQSYSGYAVRYNQREVRYNSLDVMNRVLSCHKSWVRWHIQFILCHLYSKCDVINSVCVISSVQWVWSHRYRNGECDVRYSGCIVLTLCASCQI